MKLLIFLWLALLFFAGAQLRTPRRTIRARPVRVGGATRRWSKVIVMPGVAIRVEVVRM